MRFVDEVEITVEAGNGGSGCKSFRREAGVPMGGPDGGDGGNGGSVIAVASHDMHTLLDFRFQPRWKAQDGKKGSGMNCTGKSGEDLVIKVPLGTELLRIRSAKSEPELVSDLSSDRQAFTIAKGGRGGKGNTFFKSATRQAPEHFQPGEPGGSGTYRLVLKLMADIGLIGSPNAGKSTLISRISAARPKIADYPFTTLVPNLGVVQAKGGRSFVVADIPGLVPGAHTGKGLGLQFLRHVERTRALVHLIDPNAIDESGAPINPQESFKLINVELAEFSPELAARRQIVALTKADTTSDLSEYEDAQREFAAKGIECHIISSSSGLGLEGLIDRMAQHVG